MNETMRSDFPCWLRGKDRAIGLALIAKADFIYIGKVEDFDCYDQDWGTGYKLARLAEWQLACANGEIGLEAIRDGAVFGKIPDVDFEQEVRLAKQVIKTAHDGYYQQSSFTQLSLF